MPKQPSANLGRPPMSPVDDPVVRVQLTAPASYFIRARSIAPNGNISALFRHWVDAHTKNKK